MRQHKNKPTTDRTSKRVLAESNSLTDLASRIRSEHDAGVAAMKQGLARFVAAGRLLIEAQDQLPHGQWLPWLREHCQLPERTCQRYMELARYAADKSASVADLFDDTGQPIYSFEAVEKAAKAGDLDRVARLLLDCPFRTFDFSDAVHKEWSRATPALNLDWIKTKLMHQLKVPWTAAWCFDVADMTADGRPALRLCPWDDLEAMAKALVPIAEDRQQQSVRLDAESFATMHDMLSAMATLKMLAQWMLGGVLAEMKDRCEISDAKYQREFDETHAYVMARLDTALARGNEKRPER